MRTSLWLLLSLLLAACATTQRAPAPGATAEAKALPFLRDDYERALGLARAQGVPLFVDAWAPWCHTCLSMNANVFTDPRLAEVSDRFVWLSIDTEKPQNAAYLERYPQQIWPTLLVIDPVEERPVLRWLGSATTEQLQALLADGERAARGGAEGADALLARADRLYAGGDAAGAAALLEDLLAQAPADWPRRARAVESLLFARSWGEATDKTACAQLALDELERLSRSSSWGNIAAMGLACALRAPDTTLVEPLEARAREALSDPAIEMAVDDISGLYLNVGNAREAAGDEAGMRAINEDWLDYLETEAKRARTPAARAVYDYHRMVAAIRLQQPERALAPLLLSEREMPGDYNPPARLAMVYLELDRLDDALAASDRALALVYGPRKVRILNERAQILLARGDREGARAAFVEAVAIAESLPEAQRVPHYEEQAKAGLRALKGPVQ